MSLSNQVLDFYDDTNHEIFREVGRSIPEQLKTAGVLNRQEMEKCASEQFALILLTKEGSALRKFPMSDPGSTWLSAQYFEKTAEKLPLMAQKIAAANLKRACAIFNVPMTEKIANEKTLTRTNKYVEAADMSKVAMTVKTEEVQEDGSGHFYALQGRYAMPNAEYVKKAAAYFIDYEKEFADASDRNEFASNVLARAEELEVSLDQAKTLRKYASEGYGDMLDTQIRIREDLLQHKPEMAGALSKLASMRSETEPEVFAKALFQFDKKASLDRYYDGHLADAFKSTFEKRFTKQASGYSWSNDQTGSSLNETELVKAAQEQYDKIKGHFGSSVADQLKKHAVSIFESLPTDAKETIAQIAKGKS